MKRYLIFTLAVSCIIWLSSISPPIPAAPRDYSPLPWRRPQHYVVGPATRYYELFQPEIHQKLISLMNHYRWPREHPKEATKIHEAIYLYCKIYNLNPLKIGVQIAKESGFYPKATSPCGAKGLMQIMPLHYQWLNITDPYDIEQSIQAGCKLMRNYKNQHGGDWRIALGRYNGGRRGIRTTSRRAETRQYIAWITATYSQLIEDEMEQAIMRYVVRPGDTLWAIARRFGTTVEDLARRNHIADPDLIRVGQVLVT